MSKSSWEQIEGGLRSHKPLAPKNDAESFRADFKARAALMRQDTADDAPSGMLAVLNWRYAGAMAAVLLFVGFIGYFAWPSSSLLVTQVKSLQVLAPHSGVIIMTDEDNPGTVVWVTDLEPDNEGKG